jgi:hypothetical protein
LLPYPTGWYRHVLTIIVGTTAGRKRIQLRGT